MVHGVEYSVAEPVDKLIYVVLVDSWERCWVGGVDGVCEMFLEGCFVNFVVVFCGWCCVYVLGGDGGGDGLMVSAYVRSYGWK